MLVAYVTIALLGMNTLTLSAQKVPEGKGNKKGNPAPPSISEMIRLADNAFRVGDYVAAARWYEQVVPKSDRAILKLQYAQSLQSLGQYDKAKRYFLVYDSIITADNSAEIRDNRGIEGVMSCDNASNIPSVQGVTTQVAPFNSSKIDFSAVGWQTGAVFSTNRRSGKIANRTEVWLGDGAMDLWYAPTDSKGVYEKPKRLKGKATSKFHESSPQFNAKGDVMWFTRSIKVKDKKKKDYMRVGIFSAQLKGKKWKNVQPFRYNSETRQYCHPSLSNDGTKLYFASDRVGGFGGMDLYVSELQGGKWGKPKNLGPAVNTSGNEVFPFIQPDGTIWYASSGKQGLGGLDIFYTQPQVFEGVDSIAYSEAVNAGKPFNSTYDDFSFWVNGDMKKGYFTSNRRDSSNVGGDDIYEFNAPDGLQKAAPNVIVDMKLFVFDAKTNARIEGAEVLLSADVANAGTPSASMLTVKPIPGQPGTYSVVSVPSTNTDAIPSNNSTEKYLSDVEGVVNYKLEKEHLYTFIIKMKGYKDTRAEFSTKGLVLSKRVEFGMPLEVAPPCLSLDGVALNGAYTKRLLANINVKLTDLRTGAVQEAVTDANGAFHLCLTCGTDYTLTGDKDGFAGDKQSIILSKGNCPQAGVKQDLTLYYGARPSNGKYKEGMVLEMKNVFYDFNKANIRDDAAKDLDTLVLIMTEYPDMEVELGSHTDARGSASYNQKLSQRRADAAVEYIAKKGIDRKRLTSVGYGESVPRNTCGAVCTEAEFQANRRTEVKITKLNTMNIRIHYADNDPTVINNKDGVSTLKDGTTIVKKNGYKQTVKTTTVIKTPKE